MSDEKSLVSVGELTKPVSVFIEKISNAFGTLFEPTRIRREAAANAEAAKIGALSNAEVAKINALSNADVTAIEQRAIRRLVHEEAKKQENIESITEQAITLLNEEAQPENMEDDWISHFFEKCRTVSDKEMQGLWSSLLAGEANKPGSFSKRTIEIISTLDKTDAHLFTRLCSFAVMKGTELFPVVLDLNAEIYKKQGISFVALHHLDTLGLISFDRDDFALLELPKKVKLLYFDRAIGFALKDESNNQLEIGKVMLTQVGQQLAPICGAKMNPEFLSYMTEYYKKMNIELEVLSANKVSRTDPASGAPS
ncbi:MAG: DUF2806 domain-containing protein [Hyphomicrobiales bacterium]